MKLWLVRHAQPLVGAGLCYGNLDVAADTGATHTSAEALADVLPLHAQLVTSPLQRCELLAGYLYGLRPDLTYKKDARLAEMHFGSWEGHAWDRIGADALDTWTRNFAHHAPGGGESVSSFMQRIAQIFDATRAGGHDTVWITHAGVIRATRLLVAGQRQVHHAHEWPTETVPFGAWEVHSLPT